MKFFSTIFIVTCAFILLAGWTKVGESAATTPHPHSPGQQHVTASHPQPDQMSPLEFIARQKAAAEQAKLDAEHLKQQMYLVSCDPVKCHNIGCGCVSGECKKGDHHCFYID